LQSKQLRALQEQEFERLGSGRTHRINVRLIAATHRDLSGMIARSEFRSDLYRLNVFPVVLPPLRNRKRDIPQLVSYFVRILSQRMGKPIHQVPSETTAVFTSYYWPGNIRELQNLVERAVILSCDGVLRNPLPANHQDTVAVISDSTNLKEVDRALIVQALEAADWVKGRQLWLVFSSPDHRMA
jgi:formate hydrogenlyase transcriptional activator